MNYYIQGDAANADKIKAAFSKFVSIQEMAECDFSQEEYLFYTGQEERGTFVYSTWVDGINANIIKTHPDYKELKLPVEFKNGDIIGFNDCTHNDGSYVDWVGIYKQGIETNQHLFHCVIPSCRSFRVGGMWRVFTAYPATKEQRDLLFKKMKEAGYEWDAEKKELRKIKPHYDIKNFKPFDKVLVRESNEKKWFVDFYGFVDEGIFICTGCCYYSQCIPFEGNEHLLGTTDMPSEEFINW